MIEFLDYCKLNDNRIEMIKKNLNINDLNVNDKVDYVLDFIAWWDYEYCEFIRELNGSPETIHFGLIFRSYIVSHIRAILTLIFTKNYYHANIILRRLIEDSIYLVLFDILSRFGVHQINIFERFFLDSEWKVKAIRQHRITERDLKEKLKKLHRLNKIEGEEIKEFNTRFFERANIYDFYILLSKVELICNKCCKKQSKADVFNCFIDAARFKHFFNNEIKCGMCNNTKGLNLIPCIPDIDATFWILKKIVSKQTLNPLNNLKKMYDLLSKKFVHPSTEIDFERDNLTEKINNDEVNVLGIDCLNYTLKNLSFLFCDYYTLLKSKYKIALKNVDCKEGCKTKKKKFEHFEFEPLN